MKLEIKHSIAGINFREVVKNNNLAANKILGYVKLKNGIAEISKGKFRSTNRDKYGIIVLRRGEVKPDSSILLNSYNEVSKYIDNYNYEDTSALKNLLTNL